MPEVAPIVSAVSAAPPKEKRVKRLEAGCRVSGSFGDYVPNPNPNINRRIRMKLYGTIVRAVDKKQYEVLWDNNNTSVVFANSLAKETSFASLPPSFVPLRQQHNPEMPPTGQEAADAEEEEIIDSQRDQEETEHLPFAGQPVGGCFSSDEEDEEAAEEEASPEGGPAVGGQEEGGGGVESSSRPRKRQAQAVDDPEGRMPGQLPTAEALPKDYTQRKSDAVSLVKSMLGREVVIKHKSKSMTWVVVEPFDVEENNNNNIAPEPVGLKKFKSTDYPKETAIAELFLHLAFADWRLSLAKLNEAVQEHNNNTNGQKKKVRPFTEVEFLSALGIFIGAAEFGVQGANLWKEGDKVGSELEEWPSMIPHPEFDKVMKLYRWKEFRHFLPFVFQYLNLKEKDDPWWKFDGAVEAFNNNRYDKVQISIWLIIDETMSAWRPRTTPTGGLPNISFILRKPEPLGKCLCCLFFFFYNVY